MKLLSTSFQSGRRCYICDSPDHLASKCTAKKEESCGCGKAVNTHSRKHAEAKRVIGGDPVASYATVGNSSQNPLDILLSSDSEEGDV